jgi:glycogen synthase
MIRRARATTRSVAGRDVAIVTPWYPTSLFPFRGSFVQAMVEAVAAESSRLTVYHCDEWTAALVSPEDERINEASRRLVRDVRPGRTVAGAGLRQVPVPLPTGLSYAEIARRHEVALRGALGGAPIPASVVHAHVGLPGGWAALANAGPDTRVYVTEHATYLGLVLAQPEARAMYDELLSRCAGFFAVGDGVRDPLVEAFPHHADKIGLIPNPISFSHERAEPVTELRRWLFVGSLIHRKGVTWLLEAFAKCRAQHPALTLTLVGDGPLRDELVARAAELHVDDAVTFIGSVPPDQAIRLMREHDLLVHPSRLETFGMTVVEAVAAGMPVLVTRCGGTEETLASIEDTVGEMIEVEESPEPIVAGYLKLRSRFPAGLDLDEGRRVLAARYGYPAVARAHRAAWFPAADGPAPARPDPALAGKADSVLFLALGATRRRAVVEESARVVAAGGRAVVLIAESAMWRRDPFAPGVEVVPLGEIEPRTTPRFAEWAVFYRLSRVPLRLLAATPMAEWSRSTERKYERRLMRRVRSGSHLLRADPAVEPVTDRDTRVRDDVRALMIKWRLLGGRGFDLLVVTDPASMPEAVRLTRDRRLAPASSFSVAGAPIRERPSAVPAPPETKAVAGAPV